MSKARVDYFIISIAALLISGYWFNQTTGSRITSDAAQTLQLAINLERNSVMSLDASPPFEPSMYREPLPVWSTALGIKAIDLFMGRARAETYFEGDRARHLKYQNVLWFALLSVGAFWACFLFTSCVYASLTAALMLNIRLPMTPSGPFQLGIDRLDGEVPAAALLMLASSFLALAVKRGRLWQAAVAGVLFGLLALTKAVMFYVSGALFLVLLCLVALPQLIPHRFRWQQLLALFLAFSIIVLPWLHRNYRQLNSLQIAERGGIVLYVRAVKNQMTAEEYLGSFYVWAPGLRGLIGRLLGFSEADLQEGGRLQRLNRTSRSDFADRDLAAERAGNPEGAISFYRTARAMRVRMQHELAGRGVPSATVEADRLLRDRAVAIITEHPGKHLVMTIPFLWRGAFTSSLVLLSCLIFSYVRRRADVALFILPGIGMIAFYALFSHFIGRYSVPVVPIAIVSGLVLVVAMWNYVTERFLTAPPSEGRT